MAKFRINYPKVISQANTMSELSNDLSREIAILENILNDVRNDWKGPASEAYQSQLLALISSMKKTKNRMSNVSATIKNVATRIKQEDERAAQMAEKLR